ncbi:MAG: hypothetical protein J2P33_17240, partial [Actinobacteria bacterium]|nr:hypothetical protein [Actinomycetota bacterium]
RPDLQQADPRRQTSSDGPQAARGASAASREWPAGRSASRSGLISAGLPGPELYRWAGIS